MKLLAGLLIWVSLGFGVVATAAIYFPDITGATADDFLTTNDDGETVPLETKAAVGPEIARDGGTTPAFPAGTPLTAETLQAMRDAGVTRVKVLDFNWNRWTHKWHFVASVVGLIAGAFLTKFTNKRDLEAANAATPPEETPEYALTAASEETKALVEELPGMANDHDRLHAIINRLGELQQTHLTAYPAARDRLIAAHGLGGYAQRMDAFAAADRNINRAWSAAADGHLPEALESLENAHEILETLTARLAKAT
jgi:hypothetical protein